MGDVIGFINESWQQLMKDLAVDAANVLSLRLHNHEHETLFQTALFALRPNKMETTYTVYITVLPYGG